ncbi:MAG: hypothetical protein AAB425_07865, partial [Bdellovibrionota bacterium]
VKRKRKFAVVNLDTGETKCWGFNGSGRLGLGDTMARGQTAGQMGDSLPVINVGTNRTISAMSISDHTCVVLDNLTVKCFGNNSDGRLGLGDNAAHRGDSAGEMGDSLPELILN